MLIISSENQIQNDCKLKIVIEGIRNNNGLIGINVFKSSDGFPSDKTKAIRTEFVAIKNNEAGITICNLAVGYYAVGTFHDENNNKKLDKNLFGIPKEGVGASNNARGNFGPPKFNDAKFYLNKLEQTVTFSMTY